MAKATISGKRHLSYHLRRTGNVFPSGSKSVYYFETKRQYHVTAAIVPIFKLIMTYYKMKCYVCCLENHRQSQL